MIGAPRLRRSPYWTLLPFAALLALPFSWAMAAMGAAVLGRVVWAWAASSRPGVRSAGLPGGVPLGISSRGREVGLSDDQLSTHGLIVGASGAGKSTTLLQILGEQIACGKPVVVLDLKGSPHFAQAIEGAAREAGRPFVAWTPDGGAQWNPLARGNATELKDKLIATERFTEPHYQRAAERYLQTVLQVQAATGRPARLDEVMVLMEPRCLAAVARGLDPPLAGRVQDYLGSLTPDQISAVRGLGTRLALLSESQAGPYLLPAFDGRPEVDLRRALRGPDVVLFSLNSSRYGKLAAALGTLAIQDLVSATGERMQARGDSWPVATVAIDEFSALGSDHVLALLARGREAGVSVLLATQELADLDRAARGFRDQVLGLTAVKIAHRQDVHASAETFAQMVGTEAAWVQTLPIASPWPGAQHNRGTRRESERFIVHPNEIKSLAPGQAVVLTKAPVAGVTRVQVSARRADAGLTGRPQADTGRTQPGTGRAAHGSRGISRGDQPEPGVTR